MSVPCERAANGVRSTAAPGRAVRLAKQCRAAAACLAAVGLLACGCTGGDSADDTGDAAPAATAPETTVVGGSPDPRPAGPPDSPARGTGDAAAHPDSAGAAARDESTAATGFRSARTEVRRTPRPTPVLDSIRIGRHEGYDRIVFEFTGEPLPGYTVSMSSGPAIQCGSGYEVAVAGAAKLEIDFDPANAHTEEGRPTIGEIRTPARLAVVREVVRTCDFEARVVYAIGLATGAEYRVHELNSPTRVVLDIRPAGG